MVNNFGEKFKDVSVNTIDNSPSFGYEALRKKIQNDVQEFWFYISSQLSKLKAESKNNSPELSQRLDKILGVATEHKL